jgi:putative transposase
VVPLRSVPIRHRRECFEQLLRERDHLMKNVDGPAVRLVDAGDEMVASVLPETLAVQLGGIAEACRDGLMAVAVEAGLATALAIMNEEAAALCGGWNARDPQRSHERGGSTPASVVMGGQLLPIRRPRVHAVEDGERAGEVPLATYGIFAQGDVLTRVAIERMLAGVATRGFARAADPIGDKHRATARSTSRSAVSRRFVSGTKKALDGLLARDLSELDAAVLIVDGADFAGAVCVVALVVTADGTKVPVGLRLGDTENKAVVTALLADVVDRGLDASGGLLVVIDGAKALATTARKVFGDLALIQRCQIHKRRNLKDHLPIGERDRVDARLRGAFADPDPVSGLRKAKLLAAELERTWPDAAGSLREGLEDMFTVAGLGIDGTLRRTLVCTNMIESMISICRTTSRNVKRWRDEGDMRRRWCAAGLLEAERKFRRLRGHRQMPQLVAALHRHAKAVTPTRDTDQQDLAA